MANGSDIALATLCAELRHELTVRILPFWIREAADNAHGGFVGYIDGHGVVDQNAQKGSILNARILWAFSAGYHALHAPEYAAAAERAATYFTTHFVDPAYGGVFWMTDADGRPTDDRKHVYAQAFAIYAFAEHYRAIGDEASLRQAVGLFRLVESAARSRTPGYYEAFSREWRPLDDVRLSDEDLDAPKSMNTHLHLLEAYTALHQVWPNEVLRARITELLELFLTTIIAPNGRRLSAFFDAEWNPTSSTASFGHDIEASWLLEAAARETKDPGLIERVRCASHSLAKAVLEDGFDAVNGGIYTERGADGVLDINKEWWQQAEGIVGFVRAYERSGERCFLDAALATWAFTRDHMRDIHRGEWFRKVARDGTPDLSKEKVGPWKCPYHNTRTCIELISHIGAYPSETVAGVAR